MYLIEFNSDFLDLTEPKITNGKALVNKNEIGRIIQLLLDDDYNIISIKNADEFKNGIEIIEQLKSKNKPDDMEFGKQS